MKESNKMRLKVYRKQTCSNIYLYWNSFAPENWKIGTLEGMIRRAYMICSEEEDLKLELAFISNTFHTINGYPLRIIQRSQEKIKGRLRSPPTQEEPTDSTENQRRGAAVHHALRWKTRGEDNVKSCEENSREDLTKSDLQRHQTFHLLFGERCSAERIL